MRLILACALVVGAAAFLALRQPAGAVGGYVDPDSFEFLGNPEPAGSTADYLSETDQTTSTIDEAIMNMNPFNSSSANVPESMADRNVAAFLSMIAAAEGTDKAGGYACLFGSTERNPRTFFSFADHPRVYTQFTAAGVTRKTSAAGRFQFIVPTWDSLAKRLGLSDFGPASQDAGAIELIRERGALNDVRGGRIPEAVAKCSKVWASLPGAGYAQPERKLSYLLSAFDYAGGQRA